MLSQSRSDATKVTIQHALFTLLKQDDFSRLTTQNILSVAHISRGTFYRYYHDKYMLLNSCGDQLIRDVKEIFAENGKPSLSQLTDTNQHNAFYELFQYTYLHGSELALLLDCPESTINEQIHNLVSATVMTGISSAPQDTATNLMPSLAKELIVQNVMTILTFWIDHDFPIGPTKTYQLFVASRSLSPIDLSQVLTVSQSSFAVHN
ncbi:TetR/AcrR family transcriptional regulator [Lactiplantibacillus herbarum]|uniref:TetR/AcrR family transcriptional regulator n=1 Tax=Lactiplantibacillus herbarum TaxID=1670446 RepID=UPI00069E1D3B|nr:TetR/AcrR family transcriptional regulator [Lactiplantibacillus herbarum]